MQQKLKNKKAIIVILAILLILLALFIGKRMKQNGGTINPPKNVSFVKQVKGSGQHIWYFVSDVSDGKAASVYRILVTNKGTVTSYNILDTNITLGKLSKMNDSQIISLAKVQNYKYFKAGEKSLEKYRNNIKETSLSGVSTIGFQDDIENNMEDPLNDGPYFYVKVDDTQRADANDISVNPRILPLDKGSEIYSKIGETNWDEYKVNLETEAALLGQIPESNPDNPETKQVKISRLDNLIEKSKKVKYIEPKPQPIKVINSTDPSGNEVIKQKIRFNVFTVFNSKDTMAKNFLDLSNRKKKQLLSLLSNPPEDSGSHKTLISKIFDKEYFNTINKDVFKPSYNEVWDEIYKSSTLSQPVYSSRYIGYWLNKGAGLVTKAQTSEQKAVLGD